MAGATSPKLPPDAEMITAIGEAVVFFNLEAAREFDYRCKQGGQLASKMRFLSAPWVGMLRDGDWLRHAHHSNAMAKRLAVGIKDLLGVKIAYAVDSNAVFAHIPGVRRTGAACPRLEILHERWRLGRGTAHV